LQKSRRLPPGVQRIALAESNHAFGNRTSRLSAAKRGLNALLLNQVCDQIAEHCAAMRRLLPEF
jgi:hypothetical protein